jgi:hypothetical protein
MANGEANAVCCVACLSRWSVVRTNYPRNNTAPPCGIDGACNFVKLSNCQGQHIQKALPDEIDGKSSKS